MITNKGGELHRLSLHYGTCWWAGCVGREVNFTSQTFTNQKQRKWFGANPERFSKCWKSSFWFWYQGDHSLWLIGWSECLHWPGSTAKSSNNELNWTTERWKKNVSPAFDEWWNVFFVISQMDGWTCFQYLLICKTLNVPFCYFPSGTIT